MTTAMTETRFTITRRSRNLGIGSTSQPVQRRNPTTGATWLEIESVDAPDVVGTIADVEREYDRVRRVNSGHDYRVAFFVGGVKVRRDEFLAAMGLLLTPGHREYGAPRGSRAPRYMSDAETVRAA